jgi:hypothetical protein
VPRSTYRFSFEFAVFGAAGRLCGETAGTILLGPCGEILDVLRDGPNRFAVCEQLKAQGLSFVFYDPFDAPEYIWVDWHRVSRAAMEGFVGAAFTDADFELMRETWGVAPLDPPGTFPETWGVMF